MSKLIAKVPIYYKGKQYIPGEEVPADDENMVKAWKRAESVTVVEGLNQDKESLEIPSKGEESVKVSDEAEKSVETKESQKAKLTVAPAGIPVTGENGEDVIGKVPTTEGRKKK